MKYLSYVHEDKQKYGILCKEGVYEIHSPEPDLYGYILKGDVRTEDQIRDAARRPVQLSSVKLLSPFTRALWNFSSSPLIAVIIASLFLSSSG